MTTEGTDRPPPEALAEIREVVGRAKRGDAAAVPRLRELFDRHPALWQKSGDLAAQVEQSWVGLAAGDDLRLKESVTRYTAKLRAELTRPAASPIEKLLVERAVATWLQLHYFSAVEANALDEGGSPKLLQFRAKRQAQAQRMHERALAALLTVQKLLPADRVKQLAPVEAHVGVAVETPQPHALYAEVVPDTDSFQSTPGERHTELARVGVES